MRRIVISKIFDVDVLVEIERRVDQLARLVGLRLKAHQDHRVQAVDRRHQERMRVPVMGRLA